MPKKLIFLPEAWDDFNYWLNHDKKMMKRIRILIQDIDRNGLMGIGKPEPLRGNLSVWWSRRIDDKNRLSYRFDDEQIEMSYIRKVMRDNDMYKNYSFNTLLGELKKQKLIAFSNGQKLLTEVTARQKAIYKAFGIRLPDIASI